MINPTLSKKADPSFTPTENAKKLFQVIYFEKNKKSEGGENVPKIKVSEMISKMAFYYEKIRNAVDYKEEHLLRKNAIERILKRQIFIEGTIAIKEVKGEEVASHLLIELIRAAYLPNNKIPETKISEIGQVIDKYLKLRKIIMGIKERGIQERRDAVNWIVSMAACDIEDQLGTNKVNTTITEYLYDILLPNISINENSKHGKDKEIQLFIAIYRNLLKFDRDMIGFILFKFFNSNWSAADNEQVEAVGSNIFKLIRAVNYQTEHPLSGPFNKLLQKYAVFFTILQDVVNEDPVAIYNSFQSDPKSFPRNIKLACEKRYKQIRKKLWRAAFHSIVYIFITKSVIAVLLEVPATLWLGESINRSALIINVTFPPLLLFLIIFFTKLPTAENSAKIISGIEEVVFVEKQRKEPYRINVATRKGGFLNSFFGLLYFITFFLSFGAVVWVLDRINFNIISIIIFLFFLALVSFFSIFIRRGTREMIVLPPQENILSFFADFFYIPIVSVGKWLSERFSKLNIFIIILDFIVEAPFKIFIEIAEAWTKYVKERKDEIS